MNCPDQFSTNRLPGFVLVHWDIVRAQAQRLPFAVVSLFDNFGGELKLPRESGAKAPHSTFGVRRFIPAL